VCFKNSGKFRLTAGYTVAGTALGVTGDGVYMDGSGKGQSKFTISVTTSEER